MAGMKLYLAQHGEALPAEADPERPLSERGRIEVRRVAEVLAGAGTRPGAVVHSGKLRARQSAEILVGVLAPALAATEIAGINPNDAVADFMPVLAGWDTDTLVVGHQPFMGRLAALLLGGDANALLLAFRPGSVACLERESGPGWVLNWMLRPELAPGPPGRR